MTTLYLHIGTPKTGTTFLQRFLWNNGPALEKQGYVFPHFQKFPGIGLARNGSFIKQSCKIVKKKLVISEDYQSLYSSNILEISELAKHYSNIILSDEGIWNAHPKYLEHFVSCMSESSVTLKVIVYLRVQDLYLQSMWAQKVKERSTLTFQDFLATGKANYMRLNYYERLEEIAKLIGKENLIVRVYEKSQFLNHNLTDDFFQATGLSLTEDFQLPEADLNPSLGGPYLEAKRLLNSNPEFASMGNYIFPLMKTAMEKEQFYADFKSSHYFTLEEREVFMRQFKESNAAVAREYLGRTDGKLFYDQPEIAGDWLAETFSTQELINVCGQLISIQHAEYAEKEAAYKATIQEQAKTIIELKKTFTYRAIRKLKHIFKM